MEDMLNLNHLDVGEIVRDHSEGGVDLKSFAPLDHDNCARKINDTMTRKEVGELDHHHSLHDQEYGKGQLLSTEEETAETMSKENVNDPKLEKDTPKPPRHGGGMKPTQNATLAPKELPPWGRAGGGNDDNNNNSSAFSENLAAGIPIEANGTKSKRTVFGYSLSDSQQEALVHYLKAKKAGARPQNYNYEPDVDALRECWGSPEPEREYLDLVMKKPEKSPTNIPQSTEEAGALKAMVDAAHHQSKEEEKSHSTEVDEDETAKVDIEEANPDTQVNQIDESIKSDMICNKEYGPHDVANTMGVDVKGCDLVDLVIPT